ncbi:hypothetical protein BESB_080730 [Besnoitia besnoiti]|uniref:Tyrosine specific protein phosphatases domain-containing protein n=1 Tax=Besnoitia besnoiti TaxID=94643 RepID=A0A2A9ME03_BESBE|nr:hypothetical protein BESB_080730 [Besnoitia besnoiti]PFH33857.1 hypothetical protein BESB_080730 [Besnoitia besnoiti]
MELGSYAERQRQRDPLNVEQEPPAAFSQQAASRASALRSAFAGGWLGGDTRGADALAEDAEFAISGYSPYDVAYRGQAYGDSALVGRAGTGGSKTSRVAFLFVGVLIAISSAYFLFHQTATPHIVSTSEGDPCVVDRSPGCAAYPFYDGFDSGLVRMIDADTTTNNFLFRSAMPLDPLTHNLALYKAQMAVAEQAERNALQLPARAKMLFFSFQWDGYNGPLFERCEVAREACQARAVAGLGAVHWPLFGQNVNPFSLPEETRTELARTFPDWDVDALDQKVSLLHQVVHVSTKENTAIFTTEDGQSLFAAPAVAQSASGLGKGASSAGSPVNEGADAQASAADDDTPVIAVIHCHHGSDRTGAATAAYKMRYLGFSLDAVFRENRALGQRLLESLYAMMWYCLYLETALEIKTAACHDVIAAHPDLAFVSNGHAPQTPPGVLPLVPVPPSVPGPRLVGPAGAQVTARAPAASIRGAVSARPEPAGPSPNAPQAPPAAGGGGASAAPETTAAAGVRSANDPLGPRGRWSPDVSGGLAGQPASQPASQPTSQPVSGATPASVQTPQLASQGESPSGYSVVLPDKFASEAQSRGESPEQAALAAQWERKPSLEKHGPPVRPSLAEVPPLEASSWGDSAGKVN